MLTIDFANETAVELTQDIFQKITQAINLAFETNEVSTRQYEVGVVFVDNQTIQEINKLYRDKDVATDVISFALNDALDNITYQADMIQTLGEIYISLEKAQEQAIRYEHTFTREVVFLALHGFLHLLGYTHENERDEREMLQKQNEILQKITVLRENKNRADIIMLSDKIIRKYIALTATALDRAYVPYSKFPVAATVLTVDGEHYTGINIENVSFGATNCAERSAIFTAVSAGVKKGSFQAIFVIANTEQPIAPCSICRQVFVEFFLPDMPVILADKKQNYVQYTVGDLVPYAFESLTM